MNSILKYCTVAQFDTNRKVYKVLNRRNKVTNFKAIAYFSITIK